jgi:D-aminoacyl-tRNA deacylase
VRIVVQRVTRARVLVDEHIVGQIHAGILALVGLHHADTQTQLLWSVEKLLGLRIFEDADGKMNLSIDQIPSGGLLLVPNFTVAGQTAKGRRPSFDSAMAPERAKDLFASFCLLVEQRAMPLGVTVAQGQFGASMQVDLVNDGPVTLILEAPA